MTETPRHLLVRCLSYTAALEYLAGHKRDAEYLTELRARFRLYGA